MVALGDAGFTVNPLTGGGIGPTVRAANMLAEILKRDNGEIGEFDRVYHKEIGTAYEQYYWVNRLLMLARRPFWRWLPKWAFRRYYGGGPSALPS
jgi:flavin-dependent dehydrogenase